MHKLLFVALALTAATPALAAPTGEEIVSALPHPFEVEEAGDKVADAVGAIVDLPIGNVIRAVDPSRARGDETIGDIAGRDDPEFEDRLRDEVAGMSTKAADAVRGLSAAAPALSRAISQLERDLARIARSLPRD